MVTTSKADDVQYWLKRAIYTGDRVKALLLEHMETQPTYAMSSDSYFTDIVAGQVALRIQRMLDTGHSLNAVLQGIKREIMTLATYTPSTSRLSNAHDAFKLAAMAKFVETFDESLLP